MRWSGRLPAILLTLVLAAAAAWLGLRPSSGAGETAAGDVAVIARGDEVAVTDHLVPGKYTLIDFYADWCPNCRRMSPALEALAGRETARLAVRKINILSWDSPVARQYGLTALPHLLLYEPEGKLVAEGEAAWKAVHRLGS